MSISPAVNALYPESLREEVERYLREMHFSEEALTAGLEDAMRYSLLAGGKRIRPVLALATAKAVGLEHHEVMPLAGAIELSLSVLVGGAERVARQKLRPRNR